MHSPQGNVGPDAAAMQTSGPEGLILLSRRQVVGGALMLGALALTGCAGSGQYAGGATGGDAALPNPRWHSASPNPPVCIVPPTNPPPAVPVKGGVVILPRTAWTSAGPRKGVINEMNGVSRITVHHEGSTVFTGTSQSDVAARLESVRASHLSRRARSGERWCDIGYHYIIDPAGRVWEGRSTRFQGAHVQDENEHNLGIMVLGNFERQRPTPQAMQALDTFLEMQMQRYNVPLQRVRTHRELGPTSCPGSSLQVFMNQTRSRSGRLGMAASTLRLT